MTYKERLTPWVIVRLLPNTERTIIARFRRRPDADGHVLFLRQQIPNASFDVIFDCQPQVNREQAS